MAKGRNGCAGNGAICSRIWKENMFRLANDIGPPEAAGPLCDSQGRTLDYLRLADSDDWDFGSVHLTV